MNVLSLRTLLRTLAPSWLALCLLLPMAVGCVTNRPARNGVFNENQYLKKSFLIRPGAGGADPGWFMKATITETSTPNPLGGDAVSLFSGLENGGALVRFRSTSDKLEMINLHEISSATEGKTEEVLDSWPVTNVDLKFRVNLDGEITNFYEENQELDWQVRQYVKLTFDKNDGSDAGVFGPYTTSGLERCTDLGNATSTLVPGSFLVDEQNDYLQWQIEVSVALKWDDAACVDAFGPMGIAASKIGRTHTTFRILYSMMRAKANPTYTPLEIAEKDPIHHKYGPITYLSVARDPNSGMMAGRELVMRFDPKKSKNTWYFAKGFPDQYKAVFAGPGGVAEGTNKLLDAGGAAMRVEFKNFDDGGIIRQYGDVRYNFVRWLSDKDSQDSFAGIAQFVTDPRTGETLSASINLNDFAIKDYYVQRIDFYLKSIGASLDINSPNPWPDPAAGAECKDGDTVPIVDAKVVLNHNGNSSLFAKMQEYLQKPVATFGKLGPQDFVPHQDEDFYRAWYALLPYWVYADPEYNNYVIPEGQGGVYGPSAMWKSIEQEAEFHTVAAKIDRGEVPIDGMTGANGLAQTGAFLSHFKALTENHRELDNIKQRAFSRLRKDPPTAFSFIEMMKKDARHCVQDTKTKAWRWETKEEWTNTLISSYWSQVMWHEFGHTMGLEHNFMASVDRDNFPHYKDSNGNDHVGLFASSVMEYNAAPDRVFWQAGWAPYDQGAIAWIYANDKPNGSGSTSISGQATATAPWKDPYGFATDAQGNSKEKQFLYCSHQHLRYTPLCRMGDSGTTPSEIFANDIDKYEWQYQWNNFRVYRKFWDDHAYADLPAGIIGDSRRFLSMWIFDMFPSELVDSLRRIGITNPDTKGSDVDYYDQLANKFNKEMSTASQLMAAYHKAIIQQSSGERPYRTTYDKYYGDVTQQGIILDKLFAMQSFVGLWPTDNYDVNQAGSWFSSYSDTPDGSYQSVAEDAIASMIGGQYEAYPYFVPLAVAQFAQDTHDPAFGGRVEIRDWIGGYVFNRQVDFLDFFRGIAVKDNYPNCDTLANCDYNPQSPRTDAADVHHSDGFNEFLGPDNKRYAWAYIPSRNQWLVVDRDRNIASYLVVRAYNQDVVNQQDDGNFPGGAYGYELQMKYTLDAFTYYN